MTKYIILVCGWGVYFFIHSWLASSSVKTFIRKHRKIYSYYRLLYSVISTIGLFLLLAFNSSFPQELLFQSIGWVRYTSLILATGGVIIVSRAFRYYKVSSFLGFKEEDQRFVRSGILNRVRHPIYSGTILIVIGFFLFNPTMPTLVSMACIFTYLPVGIALEEGKLIQQFGEVYRQYKKEVPALIPRIRKQG